MNSFNNCPDNTPHVFSEPQFAWIEEHEVWNHFKECLKCGQTIGLTMSGCPKSKDREHNYVEGVFVYNMVIAEGKSCTKCGQASGKIIMEL